MIKMVFVVNGELAMSPGKVAAQVGHAAFQFGRLFEALGYREPKRHAGFAKWLYEGQTKVTLVGKDAGELLRIETAARKFDGILVKRIVDEGRTEVPPNSITVLGLFGEVDKLTSTLPLLRDETSSLREEVRKLREENDGLYEEIAASGRDVERA